MNSATLDRLALAHFPLSALREQFARADARPVGKYAIGCDWYALGDRIKPVERARLCVCVFMWTGGRWRRVRRISGPKTIATIDEDVEFQSRRLGHPVITQS